MQHYSCDINMLLIIVLLHLHEAQYSTVQYSSTPRQWSLCSISLVVSCLLHTAHYTQSEAVAPGLISFMLTWSFLSVEEERAGFSQCPRALLYLYSLSQTANIIPPSRFAAMKSCVPGSEAHTSECPCAEVITSQPQIIANIQGWCLSM